MFNLTNQALLGFVIYHDTVVCCI